MDICVKYYNESFVKIECSDSIFFELKDYFSFFVDGYRFNPKYKYGNWSGKIYLLDHNRLLPFGLAQEIQKFATDFEYSVDIAPSILTEEDISDTKLNEWFDSHIVYDGSAVISPYWYQKDSVFRAIKQKKQILNLPTSAGKSLIQAMLAKYYIDHYDGKVLILVPTTQLVNQMRGDFLNYRIIKDSQIDQLGGGKKIRGDRPVVISTWQSAIKQPRGFLQQFGMVLVDECHLSTGKSITDLTQGLINCIFKVGLSGSLKDGKANIMQYVGLFGKIFKPVSTQDLIADGQVTDLKINCIFLKYSEQAKKAVKGMLYHDEIKYISSHKGRNEFLANLSIKLANRKENSFLMFKHTEHGKELYKTLKAKYDKVYFISGSVDTETRYALSRMAEDDQGIIFVASYGVFSTGVSIKNLHHIILAHPVKSKVTVLQTIGRVLRKHDSKTIAKVWDIVDDFSTMKDQKTGGKKLVNKNYALSHALERIDRYSSEKFNYSLIKHELKEVA